MSVLRHLAIALLVVMLAQVAVSAQAARVALVIGNAAYADAPLKNPVNDARAVETKLEGLGFRVLKVENLRRDQIGRTLNGFAGRIKPGDEVVVFYAGHGLQVRGVNYLPAVDAQIQSETDVPLNSLNLNALLDQLDEAKAGVKILLLDACRNNPYARSFRSSARGLARVADAPSGTLMHFATRPGSVAADGTGANGLYTAQLLRWVDQPGLPVEQMFKRVAAAVRQASSGDQEPWSEGSLLGDFYFRPGSGPQVARLKPEPVSPRLDLGDLQQQSARQVEHERAMLAEMQADFDKVQAFNGAASLQVTAWERFLAAWSDDQLPGEGGRGLRGQAQQRLAQARQAVLPAAAAPSSGASQAETFTVNGVSFKMVAIPAGSFVMGSPESEPGRRDDEAQHRVSLRAFQLGQTEVTQGLWQAVMGRNPSRYSACGTTCPVEQVSWNDVQAFMQKLNQLTGQRFRLPSEAEWEYAARAGSTTAFPWGAQASHEYANYGKDDCCGGLAQGRDRWADTAPAAQFPANDFGLYDMHGNVWEWVQDCSGAYSEAPTDGSAKDGEICSFRVMRGGSWLITSRGLRSAYRSWDASDNRNDSNGFRLARTF